MSQTDKFSTLIVIELLLKRIKAGLSLSSLHLEGGHLRLCYLNLSLTNIYLRSKYHLGLLNLETLANM
jgi:hypothetical protein